MGSDSFKQIIKKLRQEKDLTQKEFAEELGISTSSVAMWETGQRLPSPDLYDQIADYFNVDIDYLYGRSKPRLKVHYDNDGNMLQSLDEGEQKLLDYYSMINQEGKERAIAYLEELTQIDRYR